MPETPKGPRSVVLANADLLPLLKEATEELHRIANALEQMVDMMRPSEELRDFELRERLSLGKG